MAGGASCLHLLLTGLPPLSFCVSRAPRMNRKHLFILGAALVLGLLLSAWFAFNRLHCKPTYWVFLQGPLRQATVSGGRHASPRWVLGTSGSLPDWLSHEDLIDIRRAIRHDMWHKAFPSVSWQTLQQAPRSLCLLATSRVQEVELLVADDVQVRTRSRFGDYWFVLTKGRFPPIAPGHPASFAAPAEPKRQPTLTESGFGESLSNHATLSLDH